MRTPSPTPIRAVAALAADAPTGAASGTIASRNLGDTIRQSRRTDLIARARWVGALGAALITLLLAPNASAMAPERFSFTDGGTDPGFQHCDGFDISLTSSVIVDGAVFFDDTGDPARFQLHWHGRDTFTNSVSGKLVINPFQFTETYDRVPGTDDFTVTLVGHRFQATTPGSGVVLQDVGRLVWSPGEEQLLVSAGQHDLLDDSQAAPYCAALS
jgi:hypothetical protein